MYTAVKWVGCYGTTKFWADSVSRVNGAAATVFSLSFIASFGMGVVEWRARDSGVVVISSVVFAQARGQTPGHGPGMATSS